MFESISPGRVVSNVLCAALWGPHTRAVSAYLHGTDPDGRPCRLPDSRTFVQADPDDPDDAPFRGHYRHGISLAARDLGVHHDVLELFCAAQPHRAHPIPA